MWKEKETYYPMLMWKQMYYVKNEHENKKNHVNNQELYE